MTVDSYVIRYVLERELPGNFEVRFDFRGNIPALERRRGWPAQAAMHDPGFRTTELGRCIIRFVHFFDVLYQRVLGGNCGAAFPPLCTTAHFPCKMLAGAAGRVSHLQTTMMHFTMYIVS